MAQGDKGTRVNVDGRGRKAECRTFLQLWAWLWVRARAAGTDTDVQQYRISASGVKLGVVLAVLYLALVLLGAMDYTLQMGCYNSLDPSRL